MSFTTNKNLGQHFLVDTRVIGDIVAQCAIKPDDAIIEIGAGHGALTSALPPCAQLHLIELDKRCITYLAQQFPHARLWHADAARFAYHTLLRDIVHAAQHVHIVGNLPYNASSQIIVRLLRDIHAAVQKHPKLITLFFMVQKELAQRICATAGSKHYGRLSVVVQTQAQVELSQLVLPESFSPPPKVDSQLIRLTPLATTAECTSDYQAFVSFVQRLFQHKRKTLANNIRTYYMQEQCMSVQFDFTRRAESCSVTEIVQLFHALKHHETD